MVSRELGRRGLSLLNYIDDFRGVAASRAEDDSHFAQLQGHIETPRAAGSTPQSFPPPLRSWSGWGFRSTP